MKIKNITAIAAITVAAIAAQNAQAAAPAAAPADSASMAMASIVANYLRPALERQYPADDAAVQMFTDGVGKAFAIEPVDEVYYQGLSQGLNIRDNLDRMRAEGYPIDNAAFLAELRAILSGRSNGMTADEANLYMAKVEESLRKADSAEQDAFLAAQAAREGVTTLPSGLLFEVITEGEGDHPTMDDTVEVRYTGRLANGNIFDQTRDNTAKFPIKNLIRGFSEGLTMMRPGGTYRLFIPSELGYGERGAGKDIPAGAALDFTVTLVDIVK
ncbi:MAG: FKBP-type peptidyl-prolyl cis-trans isomerase [Barnesiella sp.]|nr:FKBP-type peptidyl-prolyl cis-trans isomerase [Barnesiella sp.]